VLVGVCAADCLEAHARHADVLRLPALQRRVRADVLHGRRASGFPIALGRRHRVRVPGGRTSAGWPQLRHATPNQAPHAACDLRCLDGLVAGVHHRVYYCVQASRTPTVRRHTGRRVRRVHVLRSTGHSSSALDTQRRGVPNSNFG